MTDPTDVPSPSLRPLPAPIVIESSGGPPQPLVSVPHAYEFRDGTVVIGSVSAVYDLSDCPAQFQTLVRNTLLNNVVVIQCGHVLHPRPPQEEPTVEPTGWEKMKARLKGWFIFLL